MRIAPKPKEGQTISLERLLGTQTPDASEPLEFSLTEQNDHWLLTGIEHRNWLYTVRLGKELIKDEDREFMTHDFEGWIRYNRQRKNSEEFSQNALVLSAPAYMSIFLALSKHKDHPELQDEVEKTRQQIVSQLNIGAFFTLTRCYHHPSPNPVANSDKAVHNYGMIDQYETRGTITFEPKYLDLLQPENAQTYCQTMFGRSMEEVNQAMGWISDGRIKVDPYNRQEPAITGFKIGRFGGEISFVHTTHNGNALGATIKLRTRTV